MKKLTLAFTLLSSLGVTSLAFAEDQPSRDRVVDHRDDGVRIDDHREARRDRDDREAVRAPVWSQIAQRKLTGRKGSVTFQMNRASSDDDRLRLAITGGSARIKLVTITYVGGKQTVLRVGLMSGAGMEDLAMPARHGDIRSITIDYAKVSGRRVAIQLEGVDLPERESPPKRESPPRRGGGKGGGRGGQR